jgi:hypothetical protein
MIIGSKIKENKNTLTLNVYFNIDLPKLIFSPSYSASSVLQLQPIFKKFLILL